MTANTGEPNTEAPAATRRGRVPADTFSNRLTLARKLEGLSIKEAVAQVNERTGTRFTESSWSNWEAGMRPRNEADVMQAVAWGLDVDEEWLFWGGPLEGPKGRPVRPVTKRSGTDTLQYSPKPTRPMSRRPTNTRPAGRGDTVRPVRGRPVVIGNVLPATG